MKGKSMFCPTCRAEFREGFTFCKSCNEPLVKELPPECAKCAAPEEGSPPGSGAKKPSRLEAAMNAFHVEKWLKKGAIIYVVLGILNDIARLLASTLLPGPRDMFGSSPAWITLNAVSFCYTVVSSVLWGAFFFALGRIIEILQEGLGNGRT